MAKTLEEVVAEHRQTGGPTKVAKQIRCLTTGELGTIREFAERILAADPGPKKPGIKTVIGKISRVVVDGTAYKGLKFADASEWPPPYLQYASKEKGTRGCFAHKPSYDPNCAGCRSADAQ